MTESTQLHQTDNSNSGVKMEPPVSPAPSEQQYSLKWNDFQSSILSSFRHLRDEEDFVDVTLACDQRSFTAHKVVLSACSPYFRKLLKANPCEHPIVILRDVRAEDVESLLRFMYNGEVHIGHEQLSDFLKTAQLLQVRGLADVSGPSMGHTMTSSSRLTHAALNTQVSTPTVQELKPSPVRKKTSGSLLPWDLPDDRSNQNLVNTPPPQKRIKSIDLYRAQHGLSPDRNTEGNSPSSQGQMREKDRDRSDRESDRSRKSSLERDRSLELRDSLLGQALEGGPTLIVPSQQQSNGEDSNSSDAASDREDGMDNAMDGLNGSIEHSRTPSFPSAFLGLQGLPLMPGPSGMHADNFGVRRSLDVRVRATDPRPCPKCGKIYRSAHTLRTHLEDKHTVCPGYRCVLCGTVAKSRNSLHSHMSRQHRGISTKDLPVLPMPSPFDPELASRLLAKAGVKVSPAELRARASPTSGTRRNDMKLELRTPGDDSNLGDMDNDPEDLTVGSAAHNNNNSNTNRYLDGMMRMSPAAFNHPNTTITRVRHGALTPKSNESISKDSHGGQLGSSAATGSAILDTYLQFITENTFGKIPKSLLGSDWMMRETLSGMGISQEQAAAALHAAKMAQLGAMGHGLDKLPPGLLPSQLDLHKINNQANSLDIIGKIQHNSSVTIEPSGKREPERSLEIKRDDEEPMDLGTENTQTPAANLSNDGDNSSGEEGSYSDDEGVGNS
ncbi:protein abrupt isoform X4 [Phlebotomus papatasi]|uniref:protein abrupt isoform X4 n=1 Tax=Phlebotomus papatasi TaxID=29031 RepID=UPI00248470E9|nr:protein abrupt isoform X4 [Phlebotomus papatasi]